MPRKLTMTKSDFLVKFNNCTGILLQEQKINWIQLLTMPHMNNLISVFYVRKKFNQKIIFPQNGTGAGEGSGRGNGYVTVKYISVFWVKINANSKDDCKSFSFNNFKNFIPQSYISKLITPTLLLTNRENLQNQQKIHKFHVAILETIRSTATLTACQIFDPVGNQYHWYLSS